MAEYPDEPLLSKQEIAHDRGRICKKRGCVVCAPLRERRQQKRSERKAAAQAALHDKGQPCRRTSCELPVCVEARAAADRAVPEQQLASAPVDSERAQRLQAEKHRVGLPCGSEECAQQECIVGFANERKRRHKAGRPCRASDCDKSICTAARSAN